MRPYFSKMLVVSGSSQSMPRCNCVRVVSVAGTLTLAFNGGNDVPALPNDIFKADFPDFFESVKAVATGGDAILIYGKGSITASSVSIIGTGAAQIIGSAPEGVLTANPGVLAYNTADGGYWVKATGTGNTGWVQLIA